MGVFFVQFYYKLQFVIVKIILITEMLQLGYKNR